jgi:hypothetical protein
MTMDMAPTTALDLSRIRGLSLRADGPEVLGLSTGGAVR